MQSFGLYEPNFLSVPLVEEGADPSVLEDILSQNRIKLFYSIPNFQNPTGTTYSKNRRQEIATILQKYGTILVEDNPYGEIRFMGSNISPIKCYLENSVLLGSFSKIVSPGMRLGWIVADEDVMEKLVIAKQTSDLHSNYLAQRIVYRYLMDYDVEEHLKNIKKMYKEQRDIMVAMIKEYFPPDVEYTQPEGGMFLWVTLPKDVSSMELFDTAIKQRVAFVPGEAFYTDNPQKNTLRLNFSNSSNEKIEEGIKRLGNAIEKLINDKKKVKRK
ncbi:MAG: PLP-dependent aminotransferase family protein [Methanobacterium paludis]|nr:PLP-dependent aminotransferase family protein [Methanobacterium paludis]